MLGLGFQPIGKQFPIFLNPETKEEYALARSYQHSGDEYQLIHSQPETTIEEDLYFRDLTINAMAMDEHGTIIDPYNGMDDIKNKVLRHVNEDFFPSDPIRVLRTARFAARYKDIGFSIAPETQEIMTAMLEEDALLNVHPERLWKELSRGLMSDDPAAYIESLRDTGALKHLLPEVDVLFGVPQRAEHHPEVDTGLHTLMTLNKAAELGGDLSVRFAALVHDLGKGLTDPNQWPKHPGHEELGVPPIKDISKRLSVPRHISKLATHVAKYHLQAHTAQQLNPKTIVKLFERTGALKSPETFDKFLQAVQADAQGRLGFENRPYPQKDFLRNALNAVRGVEAQPLIKEGFEGERLVEKLYRRRIVAVKAAIKNYDVTPD
jgi:tRNA nucleotidyltransferase (CCA-adding enzyme)